MNTEAVWILGAALLYVLLVYLIERQHHRETRWKLSQAHRNWQIAEARALDAEQRVKTAQKAVARGGYTYRELLEDV